jgi:hypothetical protein
MQKVGFQIFDENDDCWSLAMCDDEAPFEAPKHGALVQEFVLMAALSHARLAGLAEALAHELGIPAALRDPPRTLEEFAQMSAVPPMSGATDTQARPLAPSKPKS